MRRCEGGVIFPLSRVSTGIRWPPSLVILWIGGNDISPNRHPGLIIQDLIEIKCTFEVRGTCTILMTIENRNYRPSNPHYVLQHMYNCTKNAINRALQRRFRGRISLTGGITLNSLHNSWDGVHIDRVGSGSIQRKVLGVCERFLETWRRRNRIHNLHEYLLGHWSRHCETLWWLQPSN